MKTTKFAWCLPLFLMCVSFAGSAKLRVAYIDIPPYAYVNKSGVESGLLVERFKDIIQHIGADAEFIHLPHRRKIEFIEQGKVDLWAGQRDSRVDNSLFIISQTPLFFMDLRVYWKAVSKRVKTLGDLDNKKLILISSYSYGGHHRNLTKNSHSVDFVINHEEGFDKLFSGSDKYFLGYHAIAKQVIIKYQIENWQETSLAKYALYLKISKDYPNAPKLMDKVNGYLLKNATVVH